MKPVAFEYCRPDTLGEALDLLAERRERAAVLAGGMSLGPMLNLRMVRPECVIDISRLGGLDRIEVRGDRIVTGATVIQADALESEVVRKESLAARPEQVKTLVQEAAQTYEQPEAVVRWHYEKPERLADFENMAVEHNVVDWVLGKAQVKDVPTSFEALMGPARG